MNIITFGAIKIGKRKFDYSKYTHNIRSLDIEKITSDKVPVSKKDFKYFKDYKDFGYKVTVSTTVLTKNVIAI